MAFIAWAQPSDRPHELAAALDGEGRTFFDLRIVNRRRVPVRYAISAVRTTAYLIRRRPRSVVVQNPPVFPGLIAWAYGRLAGAPVVLDSHPSSFGLHDNPMIRATMGLHRWLARHVSASIVSGPPLVQQVSAWGGRAFLLHEAPPNWSPAPIATIESTPARILYVCVFSPDEPVEAVLQAARALPDIEITITGDTRRADPGLLADVPPNVRLVGYLNAQQYRRAVEAAHAVVVLTELPEAVNRGALEAIFALRPLIVSDWPGIDQLFPFAIRVRNDAAAIAAGIRDAVLRHDELRGHAEPARQVVLERWQAQLVELRAALGL